MTSPLIASPLGDGELLSLPVRPHIAKYPSKGPMSRSGSLTSTIEQLTDGTSSLDLDELFTKYTIAEVKSVQQRLRLDAGAKQEELRLMVGERYRDLLQASTSIISMAQSSKRVMNVVEDAREAIATQNQASFPKETSAVNDDTQLQMLQLLSAHTKLLLDAPEHLWRLIERKNFFPAAWLFLLARVVYRALVTDDEQDDGTWRSQGLDVLEQFPLVQRQWDAVSPFRSQIVHKATLSLREYMTSVENTCATLLTLHILDSRPLTETLSVLVDQRSRALHAKLSWTSSFPESAHAASSSRQTNRYPPEKSRAVDNKQATFRRMPVREVRQAIQSALDVIARTVKTARNIFQEDTSNRHSLIGRVLEYIQSDSHTSAATANDLPAELRLTTPTLLTTLPSSTHFLLLPPNLKSYKPYVDLNSTSSFVSQDFLVQKLDEWFRKSTDNLQNAIERWIADLQSVKEVWSVRSSVRKWIASASGLGDHETLYAKTFFDKACCQQVLAIWKLALARAEKAFREQLESTTSTLAEGQHTKLADISPIEYLFQAPPLPTLSQGLSPVTADSSFQKYKSALRRQLMGRTSFLDDILSILETCAKTLQQDLSQVFSAENDDDGRILGDQLTVAYGPDAETLCYGVITTLNLAVERHADDTESNINSLVFIGRVADELSSSSPFVSSIGCSDVVANDFRKKTRVLHDRTIDRWREHTVARCVHEYWQNLLSPPRAFPSTRSEPSTTLVQSLLSLSTSIQQLGLFWDPSRQESIAEQALHQFFIKLLYEPDDGTKSWEAAGRQALQDLKFLGKLADLWGIGWAKMSGLVNKRAAQVQKKLLSEDAQSEKVGLEDSEHLVRTQTLFAALLPRTLAPHSLSVNGEKSAALLPFGTPSLEQEFQSPVQLAKPLSRFGLLLIENDAHSA